MWPALKKTNLLQFFLPRITISHEIGNENKKLTDKFIKWRSARSHKRHSVSISNDPTLSKTEIIQSRLAKSSKQSHENWDKRQSHTVRPFVVFHETRSGKVRFQVPGIIRLAKSTDNVSLDDVISLQCTTFIGTSFHTPTVSNHLRTDRYRLSLISDFQIDH